MYGSKSSFDMRKDAAKVQKSTIPVKKVFFSQMDEKRRKMLRYHYYEKWNLAHICKSPKVYLLQGEDSMIGFSESDDEFEGVSVGKKSSVVDEENLETSIHAISSYSSNNAMRLLGRIEACFVKILVDSGSTHNFMDPLVV